MHRLGAHCGGPKPFDVYKKNCIVAVHEAPRSAIFPMPQAPRHEGELE
jgi:hypothetical protein